MKELVYQVEFLSDIVLPATSNTEGNIEQLDFIAGSNFLGMVAKNYQKFEDSFNVFHSGLVRFGDATLLRDGKKSYKMPLSYFHEKADATILYNHHYIKDFSEFQQLKQKRKGYITEDNKLIYLKYNYTQKSAYDKENRRSKDSSMFGYSAMRAGSIWSFSIKVADIISKNDIELIQKSIEGQQRLGKSKSAQYGLIDIKYREEKSSTQEESKKSSSTILYFKSRVALVDEEGNPTYNLKYLFDNLDEKSIDYQKCQLKTSTFTPYNRAMQTKSYERVVINSGSVVVINDLTDTQLESIKNGVGIYLSEGFGEILINPQFLLNQDGFKLTADFKSDTIIEKPIQSNLGRFLKNREDDRYLELDILKKVDMFKFKYKLLYKNIKPSQWGKIRSICTSGVSNFKEEIEDYISKGTKKWEKEQIEKILEISDSLEFIKLLSIQMPKGKSDEN